MRNSTFIIAFLILATFGRPATAQDRSTAPPAGTVSASEERASAGQIAMQTAAKSGKYIFVFFWKEKDAPTEAALKTLQSALKKNAAWAVSTSIEVTDSTEEKIVDQYGVRRAPMPLVLAVAPNGAITKGFTNIKDEKEFDVARVSPGEEKCLKYLQDRKLVFICIQKTAAKNGQSDVPQGVQDLRSKEYFKSITEVITINAADKKEAAFLDKLQVDAKTALPVAVLFAPPGALVGKFDAKAPKDFIEAKLISVIHSPCSGGSCGAGGCGPKK